jgi:uncharacterized protein (TIGR02996 family)
MKDDDTFVQTILDNPGDESNRLIYADWLEEQGDPRAEFVRLDVALVTMPTRNKKYQQNRNRLIQLRKAMDSKWARVISFRKITTIEGLVHFLREFHRFWMESPHLDSANISDDLPHGLSLVYRELGALFKIKSERTPFAAQDALLPPKRLKRIKGMVEFAWENQGNWSCRCPLQQEDPPVYSNAADVWDSPARGFQKVCDSLSHFLITLTLQEAVMSAPCLVAVRGTTPQEVLKVTGRPLWIGGQYVDSRPERDFFAIPENDVLIMDWAGLWLGSHTDAAVHAVKPGVKYNRLH